MAGDIWSVALIGGPIVLLLVAIWVWSRNRAAPPGTVTRAERGAEELRDDIEAGAPPPRD